MALNAMSLLHLAKLVCLVLGSVLGFVAARIWFKASTAKVTYKDERLERLKPDSDLVTVDSTDVHYVATAMEQSRLNKIAAIVTAFAVLFQALAGLLNLLS
jgi:hypothetical protein